MQALSPFLSDNVFSEIFGSKIKTNQCAHAQLVDYNEFAEHLSNTEN